MIADALVYCGVITIEMFVTGSTGDACLEFCAYNEIAPRVHNSGHWTLDGATTSQFEQHIRAIAGWPLGAASRHGAETGGHVEMENLIGGMSVPGQKSLVSPARACIFTARRTRGRAREMGHVTRILPGPDHSRRRFPSLDR